jgi:hypothetical protein
MIRAVLFTALVAAMFWHLSDAADRARNDIRTAYGVTK